MGKGTPIVILHGGPGLDHTYLLPQMGKLSKNYQLIFYDQRASGGSSGNADSISITMDNFIQDLEGIRKAFNLGKMNLLGHSFGGLLAMYYSIKYPDNLNSLILLNTAGASREFIDKPGNPKCKMSPEDRDALKTLMESDAFLNFTTDGMEKFFRLNFKKNFYDKSLLGSLNLSLNENTAKHVPYINSILLNSLGNFDIHYQLKAIKCITLIIHSEYDPVRLELIERIQNNISNSKLVVLEKCGHFPFIESQEKLFSILEDFKIEL
jgi:proline iminopeptidase